MGTEMVRNWMWIAILFVSALYCGAILYVSRYDVPGSAFFKFFVSQPH